MLKLGFFPFHMVDFSPWPLLVSSSIYSMILSLYLLVCNEISEVLMTLNFLFIISSLYGWLWDIVKESFYNGNHTFLVQNGLKFGMIMFIVSEIFFFTSFFWSLLYYSITPSPNIFSWPPTGIVGLDPMGGPLLGTLLLLSSGVSVTWGHHSIIENHKKIESIYCFMISISLGVLFMFLQFSEYYSSTFSISDSVYGSTFFLLTGFHGIHVIIGIIMLLISFIRLKFNHFSYMHHVGLEMSIWYWHFVDVIWLILYICVYWWGK